jgi:hypothetical protein
MSWSMFAAPSIARKKGSAPNEQRLLNALEALSSPPTELLPLMQQAIKEDDNYPALRKELRVVERLGVPLSFSRADIEPLYKAYVQLYGPFGSKAAGDMEKALQVYGLLLGSMEYHLEMQRRISSLAQAELALLSGRAEELEQLAQAYDTRLDAHIKHKISSTVAGLACFYPQPQALGDMLYAMINNKMAEGSRAGAEYVNATVITTLPASIPNFQDVPKIKAVMEQRTNAVQFAMKSTSDVLAGVSMYNPEEVRSLGFVPVLTDDQGTAIDDLDNLQAAFKGGETELPTPKGTRKVKRKNAQLAIRFLGDK